MKRTADIFYGLEHYGKKWTHYFDVYDKLLPQYIGKNPKFLEIGVDRGGSLELWLKYFDNNIDLYAVDINPDSLKYEFNGASVNYALLDQSNEEQWNEYLKDKPNFDVIVDDGSHINSHQILTLLTLYPKLNDGGIYVVEDTHTSYWHEWNGGLHKQGTFIEFAKGLLDYIHMPFVGAEPPKFMNDTFKNLKSITFYNSLCILEKGQSIIEVAQSTDRSVK